jgi:hypothetical protein
LAGLPMSKCSCTRTSISTFIIACLARIRAIVNHGSS